MAPSEAGDLEARLRGFLRDQLRIAERDVGPDTRMVTAGILDSVAMVRLAALLERELGLRIPDRDITAENFDTLRKIQAYVERKLKSG